MGWATTSSAGYRDSFGAGCPPLLLRSGAIDRPGPSLSVSKDVRDGHNVEVVTEIPHLGAGEWLIHLPGWIIEDGNYEDFAVEERRKFALEFIDEGLRDVQVGVRSAVATDGGYDVTAQIANAAKGLVLIDFGLLAYSDGGPRWRKAGRWVAGPVSLSVDCFSYFETHGRRRGIPPAVYTWTISGLWHDTAQLIRKPGFRVERDAGLGYLPVGRTGDVKGYANYVMRCRLEDEPATEHP